MATRIPVSALENLCREEGGFGKENPFLWFHFMDNYQKVILNEP
jgi:hypothetical protein